MGKIYREYATYRDRLNRKILETENNVIKRFFALDTLTYHEGALPTKTKEMLGLACSMVMRCDDCIRYHISKCRELGVPRNELIEIFGVALIVGGSIVIPHIRRAIEFLDDLEDEFPPSGN